ncbi:MAG: hypothetical protein IAF38_10165, partial [Bacteroidia bacterium]|nr:hypothetical protein [Bacteroidia bacterium]
MSVLEQIRKRTGLLVGIIGFALVLFIWQIGKGNGAPSGPEADTDAAG